MPEKKNIFILLGAANYLQPDDKLPPCQNDIIHMQTVLEASGKYDDHLVVFDKTTNETNVALSNFIKKHQDNEISELFFYFTGHGSRDDDFRYLLADYKREKHNSTSLTNTVLDSMLRSVKAEFVVKVVDACHSSSSYVKSDEKIKTILDKSSKEFKSACFMFSSRSDETSGANSEISYFTKSFLKALKLPEGRTLLYREVTASIADDGILKSNQNPQFVYQGDNTEEFITINLEVSKYLEETVFKKLEVVSGKNESGKNDDLKPIKEFSETDLILEKLVEMEKVYCTEKEANDSIAFYLNYFLEYNYSELITKCFKIDPKKINDYNELTGFASIGQWLIDKSDTYFAKVTKKVETYKKREYKSALARITSAYNNSEFDLVDATRNVPSGISLTVQQDAKGCVTVLSSIGEVLPSFKIFTVFLYSKTELVVFLKYEKLREITWSEKRVPAKNGWKFKQVPLKDHNEIKIALKEVISDIETSIIEEIKKIVEVLNEDEIS